MNRLVEAFGMPHTKRTLVGDHLIRGVSGGERKRVSLTEMLAINAAIVAWDNSIRGYVLPHPTFPLLQL